KVFVLGMPATAVGCFIGSSSRGAVVALAAVGFWALLRTKQQLKTISALVVLSVAGWLLLPAEQKARCSSAGEDKTSLRRIEFWKAGLNMAVQHPVLGIGYFNWTRYYTAFYVQD